MALVLTKEIDVRIQRNNQNSFEFIYYEDYKTGAILHLSRSTKNKAICEMARDLAIHST